MRIGLRLLNPEAVRWLGDSLKRGGLSCYGLARELCDREDWRIAKGKLCFASAARLRLSLPAQRERPGQDCQPSAVPVRHPLPRPVVAAGQYQAAARALHRGPHLWRAMLDQHHSRKQARVPGCRLTYLLESSRFGILGGVSFVAAPNPTHLATCPHVREQGSGVPRTPRN